MTEIEILKKEVKQLLEDGKLFGRNKEFAHTILKYNKTKLNELSSRQCRWLRDIVNNTN